MPLQAWPMKPYRVILLALSSLSMAGSEGTSTGWETPGSPDSVGDSYTYAGPHESKKESFVVQATETVGCLLEHPANPKTRPQGVGVRSN